MEYKNWKVFVMVVIIVSLFTIGNVNAFQLITTNNTNNKVSVFVDRYDHGIPEYEGMPVPNFGGSMEPGRVFYAQADKEPGIYIVRWVSKTWKKGYIIQVHKGVKSVNLMPDSITGEGIKVEKIKDFQYSITVAP